MVVARCQENESCSKVLNFLDTLLVYSNQYYEEIVSFIKHH